MGSLGITEKGGSSRSETGDPEEGKKIKSVALEGKKKNRKIKHHMLQVSVPVALKNRTLFLESQLVATFCP